MRLLLTTLTLSLFIMMGCADKPNKPTPAPAPAPAPNTNTNTQRPSTPPPATTPTPSTNTNNQFTFPTNVPQNMTYEQFLQYMQQSSIGMPSMITPPSGFSFSAFIGDLNIQMPGVYDPWAFTRNYFNAFNYYPISNCYCQYVSGQAYWNFLYQNWLAYARMQQIQANNYYYFLNYYLRYQNVMLYNQFYPQMNNYYMFQTSNPTMFLPTNGYTNDFNMYVGFNSYDTTSVNTYLNFMVDTGAKKGSSDSGDAWYFNFNMFLGM